MARKVVWQGSHDGMTWVNLDEKVPHCRHDHYRYRRYHADPVSTGEQAADWLRKVADTVEAKSLSYGDSIGNPMRVFSSAGVTEGIRVRIDDKLSRIARAKEWPGDDTIVDLVGYLALLAVTEKKE